MEVFHQVGMIHSLDKSLLLPSLHMVSTGLLTCRSMQWMLLDLLSLPAVSETKFLARMLMQSNKCSPRHCLHHCLFQLVQPVVAVVV
jgi:hypothetical protein